MPAFDPFTKGQEEYLGSYHQAPTFENQSRDEMSSRCQDGCWQDLISSILLDAADTEVPWYGHVRG